ncbi:uncharacterized protein LOC142325214 [Lycorma delicatula]|uniref:uncharacterized protein LOC142325214 n=1 Tax=Lycorma delicatula TaxID=130591 RepID=UPI003F511321
MFESKKLVLICSTFLLYQFEHNVKAFQVGGSISIPAGLGIKGETDITNDGNSVIKDYISTAGVLSSEANGAIDLGTEALKDKLNFDAGILNYGLAAGQNAFNTAKDALNSLTIDTTEDEKDATSNSPVYKLTSAFQNTEGLNNKNDFIPGFLKTGLAVGQSSSNTLNIDNNKDETSKSPIDQFPIQLQDSLNLGKEVLKKKLDFDANLLKNGLAAGQSALNKSNLGLNVGTTYGISTSTTNPFITALKGLLNFGTGPLQNKVKGVIDG